MTGGKSSVVGRRVVDRQTDGEREVERRLG